MNMIWLDAFLQQLLSNNMCDDTDLSTSQMARSVKIYTRPASWFRGVRLYFLYRYYSIADAIQIMYIMFTQSLKISIE